MREEELALKCFDGDPEKAEALLTLLNMSSQPICAFTEMEMTLPEEQCCWENKGYCTKDIPDSYFKCRKPCTFYKSGV